MDIFEELINWVHNEKKTWKVIKFDFTETVRQYSTKSFRKISLEHLFFHKF